MIVHHRHQDRESFVYESPATGMVYVSYKTGCGLWERHWSIIEYRTSLAGEYKEVCGVCALLKLQDDAETANADSSTL